MICRQCGTENAEGSNFCQSCGMRLEIQPQPAPVYAAPTPMGKPPLSTNPVVNAVKKLASSPLFLTAVIAFTAQILFTIIGTATKGALSITLIHTLMNELMFYVPYELVDIIYSLGSAPIVIATIIGSIPSALICIGLWMTYSAGRDRTTDGMRTSGLTMIKVITVLQLVGMCIALVLVELALLMAVVVVASEMARASVAVAVIIFAILLFAAVFVLEIIYLSKVIKSLNTVKKTIATGIPSEKASMFVAIMGFISAACLIFRLVTSFLSTAASMTALICFGIVIIKYRDSMQALK